MSKALLSLLIILVGITTSKSQNEQMFQDTLRLNGANLDHLSEFSTYWIDETGDGSLNNALSSFDQFQHWELYSSLNVGLNPNPIWVRLIVKNEAPDPTRYWYSLYSHADSVMIFKKLSDGWNAIDTVLFITPYNDRKVKVRFSATELNLQPRESAELLIKIRNLRRPQHSFMDITTPDHNLQWEKKFFFSTAIFLGLYLMTVIFNVVLGLITKRKVFFLFSVYIMIISMVILQEELLIVLYPSREWFALLNRFSPMGMTIIGCGLHFFAVKRIIKKQSETRFDKILNTIIVIGFSYGLLFTLAYFIFQEQLHLGQPLYLFSWHLNVAVILLMMFILSLSIFLAGRGILNIVIAIFAGLWMFYFNAAGYFLNYEGVIHYYVITYPNYFYYGLSFEFIAFGFILAWRYRETFKRNLDLVTQQSKHQAQLLEKEIEIQERERTQIARDLHDDLGTTISAIKLIISNSYSDDRKLMEMVNKASKDIRFFSSTFSAVDLKYGLFETVKSRIQELNALGMVQFQFIGNGNENTLNPEVKVSTFRIFSELSNNILKHAKASKATIQIIIDEEQILIMVEDNGIGFNINDKHEGIGLGNIQRRASRFNGNVHIMTDSRSGTTVIVTIPKSNKNGNTL